MTIVFENEYENQEFSQLFSTIDFEKTAERVLREGLILQKCPFECEINVLLTDNDSIQGVNNEFRGIDRATDVLSFPMIDFAKPADYKKISKKDISLFNPDTKELLLGDIMISLDKVVEQSREYGHSIEREYAFLLAHSLLHLLGYDHVEDEERKRMEELQEAILASLNITRQG